MGTSTALFDEEAIRRINALTAAMQQETLGTLLSSLEGRGFKYYSQAGIVPADFSNQASTEGHFTLPAVLPTNFVPVAMLISLDAEFSGGAVSAATIEGGDASDRDGAMAAVNVFTGAGTGFKDGVPTAIGYTGCFRASWAPTVTLKTTTANIDQLSAGEITAYIVYFDASGVAA